MKMEGFNLNSIMILIGIVSAMVAAIFFVAPLKTIPAVVERTSEDVRKMEITLAVQSDAIKTLADLAKESRQLRTDFDRHTFEIRANDKAQDMAIDSVIKRLDRIEIRP